MFGCVHVQELVPGGEPAVFGKTLARQTGIVAGGLEETLYDEADLVAVQPFPGTLKGREVADPRLARFVHSRRPRYDLGAPVTDPDQVARRQAVLATQIDQRPGDASTELLILAAANFGAGALGLATSDVAATLAARGLGNPAELDQRLRAEIAGGSFFPFDSEGAELDRQAEEAALEAERQRAEQQRRAEELIRKNERTLEDLALFAIRGECPTEMQLSAIFSIGEGDARVHVFDHASIVFAKVPAGRVSMRTEVLRSSDVLDITVHELAAKLRKRRPVTSDCARYLFEVLRPAIGVVTATKGPAGAFDEATIEGRYRLEELFKTIATPFLPKDPTAGPDFRMMVVFDAGRFGLSLAPDVIANKLSQWAVQNAGGPGCVPEAWRSEDKLLARLERTAKYFETPLFAIDELYVPARPGILERIAMTFAQDPWTKDIRAIVADRTVVRSPEIEADLLARGIVTTAMTPRQHQRVFSVMTRLGWKKREIVIDGARVRAFTRANAADASEGTSSMRAAAPVVTDAREAST